MITEQRKIVDDLIAEGKRRLKAPRIKMSFDTGFDEAEELLNNLEAFPHLFVFACIMDRQIKTSRAWAIPYKVGKQIGGFEFSQFFKVNLDDLKAIFIKGAFHRFNEVMAKDLFLAIQDIHSKYQNNAANIWTGRPRSALVIRRFLEFKGVGIKIANMAANTLVRDYKVPMKGLSSIDISPDVQVRKFFVRKGLLREGADIDELIYLAREIYPEYPGILDIAAWESGRQLKNES
jgi:hypothetical protein